MFDGIQNILFHSNCPDGIASREILKYRFPVANYYPYQFGEQVPKEVDLNLPTLFIDCHPNLDVMGELFEKYPLYVADHHTTSRAPLLKLQETYPDRILIGDSSIGESGATLAFRLAECFISEERYKVYTFSNIIALSDTWQKDHPQFPLGRRLANFIHFFGNTFKGIPDIQDPILDCFEEATLAKNLGIAKGALTFEVGEGIQVHFVNTLQTSDVARLLFKNPADLVVGYSTFFKEGRTVTQYSIRSEDGSALKWATQLGGGGHPNAAGATTLYTLGVDPISKFLELLKA